VGKSYLDGIADIQEFVRHCIFYPELPPLALKIPVQTNTPFDVPGLVKSFT
jgi:hypothetical protein